MNLFLLVFYSLIIFVIVYGLFIVNDHFRLKEEYTGKKVVKYFSYDHARGRGGILFFMYLIISFVVWYRYGEISSRSSYMKWIFASVPIGVVIYFVFSRLHKVYRSYEGWKFYENDILEEEHNRQQTAKRCEQEEFRKILEGEKDQKK